MEKYTYTNIIFKMFKRGIKRNVAVEDTIKYVCDCVIIIKCATMRRLNTCSGLINICGALYFVFICNKFVINGSP